MWNTTFSQNVKCISWQYVVNEAAYNSTAAEIERLNFRHEILQFENYKKKNLPSISFTLNPFNLNRSLKLLQNPADGSYSYVEDFSMNSNVGFLIRQKVGITGGEMTFGSNLNSLSELSRNRKSFSTTPYSFGYSQKLFGDRKRLKLEKDLVYKKNEQAVNLFCSKLSNIQQKSMELFLKVWIAGIQKDAALKNRNMLDTLLNIAKIQHVYGRPASWTITNSLFCAIKTDSVQKMEGKHSMKFEFSRTKPAKFIGSGSSITTGFLLDDLHQKADISILSKANAPWKVSLFLKGLNECGEICSEDSIELKHDVDWQKSQLSIILEDAVYLSLTIRVHLPKEVINLRRQQCLWLDDIRVKLDGIEFSEVEGAALNTKKLLSDIKTRKQSFNVNKVSDLPLFCSKRIIALGESIHGSSTFNKTAFRCMKEMILAGKTKMVMFEAPIDLVMHWNFIVCGISNEQIENFLPTIMIDPQQLKDFLVWLKIFNEQHVEKVQVFGFDMAGLCKEDYYLKRYVSFLPSSNNMEKLKKLLGGFDTHKYQQAYEYFIENRSFFKNAMGDMSSHYFEQALKGKAALVWNRTIPHGTTRDYVMAQNVSYAIDSLLSKENGAIIYGHIRHLTPTPFHSIDIQNPPMGYYINKKCSGDYSAVCLIASRGHYVAKTDSIYVSDVELNAPPENSLENICSEVQKNSFFYFFNDEQESCKLLSLRLNGYFEYDQQFVYSNLSKQFEGVIYHMNSEGFHVPPAWNEKKNMVSILNNLMKKDANY